MGAFGAQARDDHIGDLLDQFFQLCVHSFQPRAHLFRSVSESK
jgi:hypothetical protein